MRRHAGDAGEKTQKVKGTEIELRGDALKVDRLVSIIFQPQCRFNGAATIARRRLQRRPVELADGVHESIRQRDADLVETQVALPVDDGLGKLSEYHRRRKRWDNSYAPDCRVAGAE